ncbi:MAG: neutral/alkaline non-lysosomal ceramidase N-terminal domain-containing protein, partial [Clostridia bacterium]|nr:neutral/alkaline non-lysosomal ceramidase N-terminal domain-containing protein [Clostridia bacterium]
MKKLLAILLTLALTLPLFACGGGGSLLEETDTAETLIHRTADLTAETGGGAHETAGFCAGFARADITPTTAVPLAGYGNTSLRVSQNILDPLYATCLALRDEDGQTLLIYHLDMINVWTEIGQRCREMVTQATGVPAEYILLNATHTHSGPDAALSDDGGIGTWKGILYRAVVQTAKDAIADLDTCEKILVGTTETDRLNFVRRYYKENGFVCDNADYGTGEITGHETEVDQEMRIIRFERKNQKDVVLANWQCHPHRTGGSKKYDISSDIIGVMREKAEKKLDVNFLYLQGGAGNINPVSRITGEARFTDYHDIGNALYEHLADGLENGMRETPAGKIRAAATSFQGTVNHSMDGMVAVCEQIAALYATDDRAGGNAMAVANGLSSAFEAQSIISRSRMEATREIPVACYAFGDVAITAAPFEMFCQTETRLRERSPFGFTLTCGYSNGSEGYMPAAECFPNKGYEVVTCKYVQGTAEAISDRQLELLNDLC